jgi:hypothetical protein
MPESILVAYRRHAQALIERAQTQTEKARLMRELAECVLRNRAKLLMRRLQQTNDANKRPSQSPDPRARMDDPSGLKGSEDQPQATYFAAGLRN